jgi:DNA-binding response OmpR family regulator
VSPRILFVSDDILFWSRVHALATSMSREVKRVGDEASMQAAFAEGGYTRVIADLGCRAVDLAAWAARWKSLSPAPVLIAFGSHVDEEGMAAARAAGFDHVMPNSRFSRSMREWLA